MFVRNGEVHVGLPTRSGIERSFHQMLFERRARAVVVTVEKQQSLGQSSVVEPLRTEQLPHHILVSARLYQRADTGLHVALAHPTEFFSESKSTTSFKKFFLEIGGRLVIVGLEKGKQILEHPTGRA